MKRIKNIILGILSLIGLQTQAQTIGVAPIKTFNLYAQPETAATLARLELIKIKKYQVLDRFDMNEMENPEKFQDCYGRECLTAYGEALGVDYILSGNIDGLGGKIVINLKLIDIDAKTIIKTVSLEFDNNEAELQRMIGIVLQTMHDITPDPLLMSSLSYKNEVIISNNSAKINNSGPRMGAAYTVGTLNEFLVREKAQGGLEIAPIVSNIGYQFEGQYVGTENFSALAECLINFTGLEQGKFLPSIAVMNGFRFGKAGWEFAFGPSFGLTKTSQGFFTTNEGFKFGKEKAAYWSTNDFYAAGYTKEDLENNGYVFGTHLDARGDLKINTRWLMAFGRTFKTGALNIPVNVYYSSQKGGGMVGLSVGFNVTRSKQTFK